MSPVRACCIWGSESSTAKHGITKHAKDWKGRSGVNFTVDVMSGNEAAGMGFAVLKEKYDVLLIATSSPQITMRTFRPYSAFAFSTASPKFSLHGTSSDSLNCFSFHAHVTRTIYLSPV